LLLLTLQAGAGALYTGREINKGQAEKLRQFDKDLTDANTKLGKQQERAAEAELKLDELRRQVAPRHVQRHVFLKAVEGQPKARVEIMYLRDDPECFDLAQQIWRVLQDAQWDVIAPVPIPPSVASSYLQSPTAMSVGGQLLGVTVVTHSVSEKESEAMPNILAGKNWERTPWTVLSNALLQSMGPIGGSGGGPNRPPEGVLRVVVAPRM
jgi:hypothetical protein